MSLKVGQASSLPQPVQTNALLALKRSPGRQDACPTLAARIVSPIPE
jgi:hypothetical protein